MIFQKWKISIFHENFIKISFFRTFEHQRALARFYSIFDTQKSASISGKVKPSRVLGFSNFLLRNFRKKVAKNFSGNDSREDTTREMQCRSFHNFTPHSSVLAGKCANLWEIIGRPQFRTWGLGWTFRRLLRKSCSGKNKSFFATLRSTS